MRTIYCVYTGNTIYGLSYSWDGVKRMTHVLPENGFWIELWEGEKSR